MDNDPIVNLMCALPVWADLLIALVGLVASVSIFGRILKGDYR